MDQIKIYLAQDQVINNIYEGEINPAALAQTVEQNSGIVANLHSREQPVRMIVDLTKLVNQDSATLKTIEDGLIKLTADRIAVFGTTGMYNKMTNLGLTKTSVRYCDNEAEAWRYLRAPRV